MTLLIAQVDGDSAWMVADTEISGGNLGLREREYQPKIWKGASSSLVGFAGDAKFGKEACVLVSGLEDPSKILEHLRSVTKRVPSVDFAYAYRNAAETKLYKISLGRAESVPVLHIGTAGAFAVFQALRHDAGIDHAPDALHNFMFMSGSREKPPDSLESATSTMIVLIAQRVAASVGGWATPYFLSSQEAELCDYAYSVSDPIVNHLKTGYIIPHGTADGGGFGLSFARLEAEDGATVFWPQMSRGLVYSNPSEGYTQHWATGSAQDFVEAARQATGLKGHVIIGGPDLGELKAISILRDENGVPRTVALTDGDHWAFGWIQGPSSSFRTGAELMNMTDKTDTPNELISVFANETGDGAKIDFLGRNEGLAVELTTEEIDDLIRQLGDIRSGMLPPIADQPPSFPLRYYPNPKWETISRPHVSVPGAMFLVRHPGLGWLYFVLPDHEERNLGAWLLKDGGGSADTQ